MAVEAQHLNLINTANINNNLYSRGYAMQPLSGTTTDSLAALYNSCSAAVAGVGDGFPAKVPVKAESNCCNNLPVSRKRPREAVYPTMTCQIPNGNRYVPGPFTLFGDDVSLQMQQQQLEMDRLISRHSAEVRIAIEERRKRNTRRIMATVEERIMKRLKAKDEEIEKITRLNWALQEKVKSLAVEGQIWQNLAHTNEAAIQTLQANLEQVLAAQINNNEQIGNDVAADVAQSSCESNHREEEGEECGTRGGDRMCRHCGNGESSVLLLPCRHLCLCTVCGSSVYTCPVCKTPKNASFNVIMSG